MSTTDVPHQPPTLTAAALAEIPSAPRPVSPMRSPSAPRDLGAIYSRPTNPAISIDPDQTDRVSASGASHHGSTTKASPHLSEVPSRLGDGLTEEQRLRRRAIARKALQSEFDFLAVPDWVRLHPLLGAYLAEATGTFIYVLTIGLVTVNNPTTPGRPETNITPIPIGFMLMCMVFTFGYISGGHFNPAVTAAVALAGKMHYARAIGYILCQTGAAFGAGVFSMIMQGTNDIIVPTVENNGGLIREGIFAELIYTFALTTVVLNVAYSKQKENFFYGFAIGMVIVAGVAAVGGVSGGAFNPAVATGLQAAVCVVGNCTPLMHFWLYWTSPLIGAVLSTILYRQLWQPEDE